MTAGRPRLVHLVNRVFIERIPRDHAETDRVFRRRRVVVVITLLFGAVLLGLSLRVRPGDPAFYSLTTALAVVWAAGGLLSGPLHLGYAASWGSGAGRPGPRRPVVMPVVVGLALAALFIVGALAVREIPPLRDYVNDVLAHATYGNGLLVAAVTVLNGVAEELFFRGALFAAIGRRYPVTISTVIYAVATVATGNPMLVFAAAAVGLVLGLQRRATGGILAPAITHVTWSLLMLYLLPLLFPA